MRAIQLLILFSLVHVTSFAQQPPTARVDIRNGIAVFVMCEPLGSYQATKRFWTGSSKTARAPYTGIGGTPGVILASSIGVYTGIDEPVAALTRKAVRKRKKMNAYITYDCRQAQGIMFANGIPLDDRVLARPATVSGKHAYIKNTPVNEYSVVETVSLKAKHRFVSPISPSDNIETVISKIITEANKESKVFDAVMSSDGITYTLIRYM